MSIFRNIIDLCSSGANKDYTKALDVLTIYEEENCQPTPRTLRYLAVAFKSVGLQVPFEVPEKDSKEVLCCALNKFKNKCKIVIFKINFFILPMSVH